MSLFKSLRYPSRRSPAQPRASARPGVETMEDRLLLASNLGDVPNLGVIQRPVVQPAKVALQTAPTNRMITPSSLVSKAGDQPVRPGDRVVLDRVQATAESVAAVASGPLGLLGIPGPNGTRAPVNVGSLIPTASSPADLVKQANSPTRTTSDAGTYTETGATPRGGLEDQMLGERVAQVDRLFQTVQAELDATGLAGLFGSRMGAREGGSLEQSVRGAFNQTDELASASLAIPGLAGGTDLMSYRSAADARAALASSEGGETSLWDDIVHWVEGVLGVAPDAAGTIAQHSAMEAGSTAAGAAGKAGGIVAGGAATVLLTNLENKKDEATGLAAALSGKQTMGSLSDKDLTLGPKKQDDRKTPRPDDGGRGGSGSTSGAPQLLSFQKLTGPREDAAAVDVNKLARSMTTFFQSKVNPPANGPERGGGESTGGTLPGVAGGLVGPKEAPIVKKDASPGGNPLIGIGIPKGPGRISGSDVAVVANTAAVGAIPNHEGALLRSGVAKQGTSTTRSR